MNKEMAESILANWQTAALNESLKPYYLGIPFVQKLLEAQKIIERERAVKIAQEIVRSNRFDSDIIDTLNELKQEILQSTKE